METYQALRSSTVRPYFLVYLSPLFVEMAILVSLATGFVPVIPGQGPAGPSYGFPLAWRYTFCEIVPCGISFNWSIFWLDVLFYVALLYVLLIFYCGRTGRLPRPSLRKLLGIDPLSLSFQLALLGGALMAFVPGFLVPPLQGRVCLDPSPCLTEQNYRILVWQVMIRLWMFSGFVTIFAGLMVGLVGGLGRRFMGAVLVGLSAVHVLGTQIFLVSGASSYFDVTMAHVLVIAAAVSVGPLLVFLSALALNVASTTSHRLY